MTAASLTFAAALTLASPQDPAKLAETYVDAVRELNEEHARKPRVESEEQLAEKLPRQAARALDRLLREDDLEEELLEALAACGEAALDLTRVDDFARVRARLEGTEQAARLGTALSRPRFLLRGIGGLDEEYLEHFAEVFEAVLEGYDELFHVEEWSKVPGKKLRVRVHLEERIERPPHFAPQFPFHSEIDFPVIDPEALRSPTADGKFLFYGLCHELGHVLAMWGDRGNEADHHTWAHYTGVALVEHLSESAQDRPFMKDLRDVRWRSLTAEREQHADVEPGTDSREATMALWIRLHDELGPQALGAALDHLSREGEGTRVNRVRYYDFDDLAKGLLETLEKASDKKKVRELLR